MIGKTHPNLDRHPVIRQRRAIAVLSRSGALATGAALILSSAGCGGSGKSTTTSARAAQSAAPTKAEYIAKANAICNASNGALTATVLKLATHPSPVEAAHIVEGTFVPQIKSQLSQIQAVGTPAGGQSTVATMDRLLAGDVAKIEKDPALAGAAVFHDFAKVAHAYGLTACAPLS